MVTIAMGNKDGGVSLVNVLFVGRIHILNAFKNKYGLSVGLLKDIRSGNSVNKVDTV